MYQSIPSLTIPQVKPWGIFWNAQVPTSLAQRKFKTPAPGAKSHDETPTLGHMLFINPGKTTKKLRQKLWKKVNSWNTNFNYDLTKMIWKFYTVRIRENGLFY